MLLGSWILRHMQCPHDHLSVVCVCVTLTCQTVAPWKKIRDLTVGVCPKHAGSTAPCSPILPITHDNGASPSSSRKTSTFTRRDLKFWWRIFKIKKLTAWVCVFGFEMSAYIQIFSWSVCTYLPIYRVWNKDGSVELLIPWKTSLDFQIVPMVLFPILLENRASTPERV